MTGGFNSKNNGIYSFMYGFFSTSNGDNTKVLGEYNTIGQGCNNNTIIGDYNKLDSGSSNIIIGREIEIGAGKRPHARLIIIGSGYDDNELKDSALDTIIFANGNVDNNHNAMIISGSRVTINNELILKHDIEDIYTSDYAVPNVKYLEKHYNKISKNILYNGSKQVFPFDTFTNEYLYFNTDILPDLSKYNYVLDETSGIELCTVVDFELHEMISFAKLNDKYGIVKIDGSEVTIIYVSDTLEYNGVTYQKGWQLNKINMLGTVTSVLETNDNINGNLFGETEFAFYTKVGENIVISPSGKKYKLIVDDNGSLSTSEVV